MQRERSPQLMTLVGVPGIGKSRLVAELFARIESDPGQVVLWRQGRSLPYGDGVTFWALSEMVKAQAGILETDGNQQSEAKLNAAVAALVADPDAAEWMGGHLRPLAGISAGPEPAGERRDEVFTAWRRFFEALAEQHALVLVFEDLHWADDNLLDFIEHLVDWAGGVPMLVVCTTRPELFERRPGWAGATRNAIRLSLAPLSDEETAQLISTLSERPVMEAETQQELLARAGGNPLYAEQYVRMLAERSHPEGLPVPETVQGIIAARLDALSVEEKRLLQDAAVLGKVFWLGAVVGGMDRRTAERLLHALERKDFVQRARRSSVADEDEYSFLHVLVRDVAYGQIPRRERAEKHRLTADWIASLGRPEDHAEMLAHHYLSALELRRATGQPIDADTSRQTLNSLRDAAERARSLMAYAAAAGYYDSALGLAESGSREHARLLFDLGRTRKIAGSLEPDVLAAAADELLAVGDTEAAAEAQAELAWVHRRRGDTDHATRHFDMAQELVDGCEPSARTASVISSIARVKMLIGDFADAILLGRSVLDVAAQLDKDDLRAHALNTIGVARMDLGDSGGIDDLEESLAIAIEAKMPAAICQAQVNLWAVLLARGNLERSAPVIEAAADTASRFGFIEDERWIRGCRALDSFDRGEWHEALRLTDALLGDVEAGSPHYSAPGLYAIRALMRIARDDHSGALADSERALELGHLVKDPQILYGALACCAHVFRETGDLASATVLVDESLGLLRAGTGTSNALDTIHMLSWTLSALGRGQELIEVMPPFDVPWVQAARAFAAGDLRRAADVCGAMGARTEEARDRVLACRGTRCAGQPCGGASSCSAGHRLLSFRGCDPLYPPGAGAADAVSVGGSLVRPGRRRSRRDQAAREWKEPAEIWVTPDRTLTGSRTFVVVPFPTWPYWLAPQAQTFPALSSASEC